MSKLDELIKELCPNGVEYKTLGELGEFYGGLTGKSKSDFVDGNAKFITYMNVYKNLKLNLDVSEKVKIAPNENQRTIEYGDVLFTGSSETPDECGISSVLADKTDEPLYLNSFCICYRFNDKELFNPEFSKYLFRSDNLRKQIVKTASGVTRFNVSKEKMKKVVIPIVPLSIQDEIVNILDKFTSLTAELTARRKQYEYYRDSLLTPPFEKKLPHGFDFATQNPKTQEMENRRFSESAWQYKKLGEIATSVSSGKNKTKSEIGKYIVYGSTGAIAKCDEYVYDKEQILIARVGANAGFVYKVRGKYDVSDNTIIVNLKDGYNLQYIYYSLKNMNLHKYAKGGGQPLVTAGELKEVTIPLPPLDVQERIVNVLDNFDSICTDLKIGLPAEIEVRKKQYEYYRDMLLTFASSGNTILTEQNRTEQNRTEQNRTEQNR